MKLEPGARFDHFTIEQLLGEGGMGQVYRAFDTRLRRRVALKILRQAEEPAPPDPEQSVSLILREARSAAALDHPHAVSIFEVGEHEGTPFMAMELVSGASLRSLIGRADVGLEQRLRWLADMGRALGAAHKAGIVHLDVKPENVMVRADGVVKVLDFGIARRTAHPLDASDPALLESVRISHLTASSALVGTLPYMAPEQVRRQLVDGRTDQFSWAVVAYELIAARMPWPMKGSAFEMVRAILDEDPPRMEAAQGVPESVEAVVRKALAKRPDQRFATMDEAVIALETAAGIKRVEVPSIDTSAPGVALENTAAGELLPTSTASRSDLELAAARTRTVDSGRSPLAETTAPVSGSGRQALLPATAPIHVELVDAADHRDADLDEITPLSGRAVELPKRLTPEPASQARPEAQPKAQEPAPTRAAPRGRAWIGAGVIAAALAAIAAVKMASAPPVVQTPPPPLSASAPPAPAATTLLDLPAPEHCDAASLAEYREGMKALHDGVWDRAERIFERAVAADPSCAEAHLRLVMIGRYDYPIARTRELYRRALELRGSLRERDQLLLDAYDLLVRSDPANDRAFGARMVELSTRYPGDAELAYLAGQFTVDVDARAARERERTATRLDPRYSDAWQIVANASHKLGEDEEALRALDECMRASPNSVDCVRERTTIERNIGRCAEMESDARRWIARDPETSSGHLALARALAAQEKPREAVEETLAQRWAHLAPPLRAQQEPLERALFAATLGDFAAAEAGARDLEKRMPKDASFEQRARPALLLASVLRETGRGAEATKIAADFLRRRSAWPSQLVLDSFESPDIATEPRLLLLARAEGGGWEAERAAWISRSEAAGKTRPDVIWSLGVALHANTRVDAEAAARTMPAAVREAGEKKRPLWALAGAYVGRMLSIAGKADEAHAFLRVATASCSMLDDPFAYNEAMLWLGEAAEQRGDDATACAAYRAVESRWGRARPRSVTADRAKQRADAKKCAR
jgi:serine/threonine-protein kinase